MNENSAPEVKLVYRGLADARDHLAQEGLGKNQFNDHHKFAFRGIDDLYGILQPALAHGRLVMAPHVTDIQRREYTTDKGKLQFYTVVQVAYEFTHTEDFSQAVFTYAGEAADTGDKSLSKALTMAFKSFCFHVFQIPLNGNDDADKHVADETAPPALPETLKLNLEHLAKEAGLDALREAWKAVTPEDRELITRHHLKWWNETKAAARNVTS